MSSLVWVVLTGGDRPVALHRALKSIRRQGSAEVLVVSNGGGPVELEDPLVRVLETPENVGVPAGRDLGLTNTTADVVGFLDDDAELGEGGAEAIIGAFSTDRRLGAVALRLVDEDGETARRHTPRLGSTGAARAGEVALFLGGACAIRRTAYEDAGRYFTELFYGHEELELCWRLIDRGWSVRYLPEVEVFHPRTSISRHPDGWELTGRNRVWVARRSLPWPLAMVHVMTWLAIGVWRAPRGECRQSYIRGWLRGWAGPVRHRPIRWSTAWQLTRLGRPPVI